MFLLTHLLRGVTEKADDGKGKQEVSTHTPLARCDVFVSSGLPGHDVSTHTPLARCDIPDNIPFLLPKVSTHTPLARCDDN